MTTLPRATLVVLLAPLLGGLGSAAGCASKLGPRDGTCEVVTDLSLLNCEVDAYDAAINDLANAPKLVGYACKGSVRPDDGAIMVEGVPQGRVCSDRGPVGDSGQHGYCCTGADTKCAYDPTGDYCPKDPSGETIRSGFECQGSMRPEMYNPSIFCDQAVTGDGLYHYCCADTRLPWGCRPSNGCSKDLAAWNCDKDIVPRSQELTVSKSRADTYYMTCATPKPNGDGTQNYCCYTPSVIPDGGTCVEHTSVPGCATGRFGFACTGPESPTEDYPPMVCPDPGIPGKTMPLDPTTPQYPATLYCCDFVN